MYPELYSALNSELLITFWNFWKINSLLRIEVCMSKQNVSWGEEEDPKSLATLIDTNVWDCQSICFLGRPHCRQRCSAAQKHMPYSNFYFQTFNSPFWPANSFQKGHSVWQYYWIWYKSWSRSNIDWVTRARLFEIARIILFYLQRMAKFAKWTMKA